jgi:hypothetical protein
MLGKQVYVLRRRQQTFHPGDVSPLNRRNELPTLSPFGALLHRRKHIRAALRPLAYTAISRQFIVNPAIIVGLLFLAGRWR